jgi:hypothetical protein
MTRDEQPIQPEPTDPAEDPNDVVDPLEPVADDSVLADAPDTTTGKDQLLQNDEGRPGPGV